MALRPNWLYCFLNLTAQAWARANKHDAKLNKARIAAREGISWARVTQVMNLLQLPAKIQTSLLEPPGVAVLIKGKQMCAMARRFATRTKS
jgi:hypothetical protein